MINYIINDGLNVLIEKTCLGELAYLNPNTICIFYFILRPPAQRLGISV